MNRLSRRILALTVSALYLVFLIAGCSSAPGGKNSADAMAEAQSAAQQAMESVRQEHQDMLRSLRESLSAKRYAEAAAALHTLRAWEDEDEAVRTGIDEVLQETYDEADAFIRAEEPESALPLLTFLDDYRDAPQLAAYCEALQTLRSGDAAQAAEQFEQLGALRDAPELAQNCRTYLSAQALAEAGDPESVQRAAELFDGLGYFLDAPLQAEEQSLLAVYLEASSLAEAGDPESLQRAADLFSGLGDFRDAPLQAEELSLLAAYLEASALAENEDYEGALARMEAYDGVTDADWDALYTRCVNEKTYGEADALYADGLYYQAYEKYLALGDFRDAAQKAGTCEQSPPPNGILYKNTALDNFYINFTIDNSGHSHSLLKFFTADDVLICSVFVRAGETTSIYLRPGDIQLKQAYGEHWYGGKDLFGADGTYARCRIGGSYFFTLENGYSYTMSAGAGGDSVTNESVGIGDF